MLKRMSQKITVITVQQWVREQQSTSTILFHIFALAQHYWLHSQKIHWNYTAHFRYRGSIEYRDTWDGIVIVAAISGIAQHYLSLHYYLAFLLLNNCDRNEAKHGVFLDKLLVALKRAGFHSACSKWCFAFMLVRNRFSVDQRLRP